MPDLGQWAPWEMMRNAPDGMFTKADIDKVMGSDDRYTSMREAFIRKGVDGVIYQNEVEDSGSDSIIVFSPSQIRSINAAFDPDFADSPNILAQQNFGDLQLVDSGTDAAGNPIISLTEPAQSRWDDAQSRLDMVEQLRRCANG